MTIPINDLLRQYQSLHQELNDTLLRVAQSGWYVLGPEVQAFEKEFAAYCGCAHMISVGNGTDALELALRALDCKPGDEVITVANAGFYTTTACLLTGATPVFVDVDEETLTMSPQSLAQAISPRTKAVVVTHLYGKLADMTAIQAVLAGTSIKIVEDCAQGHGAMGQGKRAGTFGDIGTYSFYPTKNLGAMGDGGALGTSDALLAEKIRYLRQYGWTGKYRCTIPQSRNSRLDEMQAAVLRCKLPHLDDWNERRRDIVRRYLAAAADTPLRIVHRPDPSYVGHLCIGCHPDREAFRGRMKAMGVETAIHYPYPDHTQEALNGYPWRAVDLSVTEQMAREIVTLPCFAELTEQEIEQVCEAIRECA